MVRGTTSIDGVANATGIVHIVSHDPLGEGWLSGLRLLVVEDHPLFREGFAAMAAGLRPGWQITFATSANEATALFGSGPTDVVVIDVGLGDGDGIALSTWFRAAYPALPILVISGRNEPALRLRAERAGASGFVAKDASADAIAAAVDAVGAGRRYFDFQRDGATAPPALTARQAEVLALLAEGHGNKEIRHRLGIAERTVRAHLTELFLALGASSRTQALIRARAVGLIG